MKTLVRQSSRTFVASRPLIKTIPCLVTCLLLSAGRVSKAEDHDSGQIIGRVFFDLDNSGNWTEGDKGVGRARIVTDRGMEIITGPDGRFHVSDIPAGREIRSGRVFVLDRSSLPAGTVLENGGRRLVRIPPSGLPVRVDFLLRHKEVSPSELKAVSIDRAGTTGALRLTSNGKARMVLGGVVPVGCTATMDGKNVVAGKNREFAVGVDVKRGINRHLLILQCNDGKVQILLAQVHRVKRSSGGDLVIAQRPIGLATCSGPRWDQVPRTSEIELNCLLHKDVQLMVQQNRGSRDGTLSRFVLSVNLGENRVPINVRLPDGHILSSMLKLKVNVDHVLGTLYGVAGLGIGDGELFVGGRLGGYLEWTLSDAVKLIVGSGFDSFDIQGQSFENTVKKMLGPTHDEKRFQRDPDPEYSWIEHGDESRIQDANPTRSNYMVQLTRKGSFLGWGGFTTEGGTGQKVGRWSRALDGGHGVMRPLEDFVDPEKLDVVLEGFWSPAVDAYPGLHATGAHEEFLSTGGTLYFLGHGLVREGSERVVVGLRDVYSGMLVSSRKLSRGVEYQIDWTSGRLMLTEPLPAGNMDSFILSTSDTGASVLIVEYEYLDPSNSEGVDESLGGAIEIQTTPMEGLRIGGRFGALKSGDRNPYELVSSELNLSLGESSKGHSRVWARWADSSGVALNPSYSVDGGITLFGLKNPDRTQAEAYEIGVDLDYSAFSARAAFRRYLAGFSDTSILARDDVNQGGVWISSELTERFMLKGRLSGLRMWSGDLWNAIMGLKWRAFPSLDLSIQARYTGAFPESSSILEPFEEVFGNGQGLLLGARGAWRLSRVFSILVAHQQSVWSDGAGRVNRNLTMSTLGTQILLWKDFFLGLEAGWGPETGTLFGLGFNSSDNGKRDVFAYTTVSVDRAGINDGWFSGGQNGVAGNGWVVSSTQTMQEAGATEALGQRTGVLIPLSRNLHLKLAYERSELHQATDPGLQRDMLLAPFFNRGMVLSGPSRRNAVFGRIGWFGRTLAICAAAEYRADEHLPKQDFQQVKTLAATSIHQTVLRFAARWTPLDGFAMTGRLAWAETMETTQDYETTGTPTGGFLEGSMGASWRPADIDWLRLIFRASMVKQQRPGQLTISQPEMGQETYFSSSFAASFYPTKYLQPLLVLAPWFSEFDFRDHSETIHQRGLVGMLRVGSEIWAGLGMSVEVRTAVGHRDYTVLPDVRDDLRAGFAGEAFYSIHGQDVGSIRFSVGYSFSPIPDPLMTELMTGGRGLFFRLEGML